MKFNNKSNMQYMIGVVIVSLIGFFILMGFFINTGNVLVSSTDDTNCRSYIAAKDNLAVKIGEMFSKINSKCKVDKFEIDESEKDKVFKEIAESMRRCWYRYGEGEYDFLGNMDTEGNWCFACATISFNSKNKEIYSYNDFVNWTSENKFTMSNGTEMSYFDYLSLKYSDATHENVSQVKDIINELISEDDKELEPILLHISQQYEYLQDLRLKQINTNEKNFVVYRYDRLPKSTTELITDVAIGAGTGLAASIATDIAVTLALSAITGPIGVFKGIASVISWSSKAIKLKRIGKLIELGAKGIGLLNKMIKYSGKAYKAIKKPLKAAAIGTGAYIGSEWNTNNLQYVDILTQEQYYRLCGTERPDFK